MEPVGGWKDRVSAATALNSEPPRGALAWVMNSGDRWLALGSASRLAVMSVANVVTDITPASFTAGAVSAVANVGYGAGLYGQGTYGTQRAEPLSYTDAATWSLDTWGENLLACHTSDRRIVEWAGVVANRAVALANAPRADAIVVTDERVVFALGASPLAGGTRDGRMIRWCDRENNTLWAPAATNEAGDQLITSGSQIMCGKRLRGVTLILTDVSAHVASYIGPPFVYGFERIGDSCGVISRNGCAVVDGVAYWMGEGGFWRCDGGSVQAIPCDVTEAVTSKMNALQASKVYAVVNSEFNEIWWFYPCEASNENDRYVAYNYRDSFWMTGELARSCGVDVRPFRQAMWASPAGMVIDQETGSDWGGLQPYAESGPIDFGETVMTATRMAPDENTRGDVDLSFRAKMYPNGPERVFGPYAPGLPTNLRFTARQVSLRITGNRNTRWRWGIPKVTVEQRGRR